MKEIEKLKKWIKKEMKNIEKETDINEWLDYDPDEMNGKDAFTRGCYRTMYKILTDLNKIK